MKLQLVLLAAFVALAAAQSTGGQETTTTTTEEETSASTGAENAVNADAKPEVDEEANKRVMAAVETTDKAIAATTKKIGEEKTACENEVKGTEDWMAAIDEKKLAAMRARRIRDKKNLLEAIKERVTVMKDYLKKLKLARNKLVGVISRVNTIYGASYDEAIATQQSAARVMTLLGLSIGHKYNPGSEFSKIKLPREDAEESSTDEKSEANAVESNDHKGGAAQSDDHHKEEPKTEETTGDAIECPDCEKKDAEKGAEISLMELEAEVHQKMSRCKGEYCEAAYHFAFDLYKNAHLNAQADFKNFQADKKIIVNFRSVVSKLITRKEGRLANLTKQADALEDALKKAEGEAKGPLMQIIDDIKVHKETVIASCKVMAGRSREMIKELDALKSCAEGKECSASDSKSEIESKKIAPANSASPATKEETAAPTGSEQATGAAEENKGEGDNKSLGAVFDADAKN